MKKPTWTLFGGRSRPYKNVHVSYFIHTSRKRKQSTVTFYNLILCHFHTKYKGNWP